MGITLITVVVFETICLIISAVATEYYWATTAVLKSTEWLPMALALASTYCVVFLLYYADYTEILSLLVPYIVVKVVFLSAATSLLVVSLTCYKELAASVVTVPILCLVILMQLVLTCVGLGYALRYGTLSDEVDDLIPMKMKSRGVQTEAHPGYVSQSDKKFSEAVTQTK